MLYAMIFLPLSILMNMRLKCVTLKVRCAEELTNDIPNVSEDATKDLDENGMIRIGAGSTSLVIFLPGKLLQENLILKRNSSVLSLVIKQVM